MGAIPNKLPGFQDLERDDEARARFEAAWGAPIRAAVRLAPDADVPRDGARRAPDALRDRREPGAVGGRHQPRAAAARGARPPRRPGHRDDADGGDGRRRAPGHRVVVRGRGDGDEQRAPRAARPQGARPARARRATTRGSSPSSRGGSGTTGASRPPRRSGTSCRSLSPMHRGMRYDRLEALNGIQWPCPDEEHPGSLFLHGASLGRAGRRAARAVQRRRGEAAVRGARRRLPDPAHDRAPPRVVQHGRPVEPLPLAAPPRRVARPLAGGRRAPRALRGRDRARLVAARLGRGAGADRPVAPRGPRVHDVPLPGRGRRQPADDRRDRPEVGHGRVQGGGDPGREAGGGARCAGTRRPSNAETAPA